MRCSEDVAREWTCNYSMRSVSQEWLILEENDTSMTLIYVQKYMGTPIFSSFECRTFMIGAKECYFNDCSKFETSSPHLEMAKFLNPKVFVLEKCLLHRSEPDFCVDNFVFSWSLQNFYSPGSYLHFKILPFPDGDYLSQIYYSH